MSAASVKRPVDVIENLETQEHAKRQKTSLESETQDSKKQSANPRTEDDVDEIIDVGGIEESERVVDEQDDDFGLQSEESNGPLHLDIEAREAEVAAKTLGLNTPEEAVSLVGKSTHLTQRLDAYTQIIEKDPVTKNVYEELTKEIEKVEKPLREGLAALVTIVTSQNDAEKRTVSPNVINFARTVMDKFVKMVIETAITHADYRESTTITLCDVLESFKILGCPVYWNSEIVEPDVGPEQLDNENNNENDDDDSDEDNDEEQENIPGLSNDKKQNEVASDTNVRSANNNNVAANNDTVDEDEQKDSKLHIDPTAFKTLVTTIVDASLVDDDDEDEDDNDHVNDDNDWNERVEHNVESEVRKQKSESSAGNDNSGQSETKNSQLETTETSAPKLNETNKPEANDAVECGYTFEPAALEAIQQSTEAYLLAVLQSATNLARYAGKQAVDQEDMRFVLNLWKAIPGSNEVIRRIRW
jgi:histone H3/H4